jgi:16S rRNA (adenine1518-N6/adenine1519-N6)-dimethyltransferase
LLSIHTHLAADVEIGRTVPASCFRPSPKITSQLVKLKPLVGLRHDVGDRRLFDELLGVAFGQRRKMVRNTIGTWLVSSVGEVQADELLALCGIDGDQRAQTITLESFARLSCSVHEALRGDA